MHHGRQINKYLFFNGARGVAPIRRGCITSQAFFFPGHSSLPKHFRGVARGCVYDGMEWNGDGRKKEGRVICDDMDGAITSTCVCVCV